MIASGSTPAHVSLSQVKRQLQGFVATPCKEGPHRAPRRPLTRSLDGIAGLGDKRIPKSMNTTANSKQIAPIGTSRMNRFGSPPCNQSPPRKKPVGRNARAKINNREARSSPGEGGNWDAVQAKARFNR